MLKHSLEKLRDRNKPSYTRLRVSIDNAVAHTNHLEDQPMTQIVLGVTFLIIALTLLVIALTALLQWIAIRTVLNQRVEKRFVSQWLLVLGTFLRAFGEFLRADKRPQVSNRKHKRKQISDHTDPDCE